MTLDLLRPHNSTSLLFHVSMVYTLYLSILVSFQIPVGCLKHGQHIIFFVHCHCFIHKETLIPQSCYLMVHQFLLHILELCFLSHDLVLSDVLFVSQFRFNLLSISALTRKCHIQSPFLPIFVISRIQGRQR